MKRLYWFILPLLCLASCNWFKEKPLIAEKLGEHFKTDLYESFDTAAYKPVFISLLDSQLAKNSLNPKFIRSYYEKNEYLPMLVTKFFANGQLDSLKYYLEKSNTEGFNPETFNYSSFEKYLNLLNQNKFKKIEQVYEVVAQLELNSAISFNKYTNFMSFGSINPQYFFDRFYIKVKRPDSLQMDSVMNSPDMLDELKNVQPTNANYIGLRNILAQLRLNGAAEDSEKIKLVKLNMERMRWQMPVQTNELVEVNIPDFSLTWFKGNDTLTFMKVCVGAKRENNYQEKKQVYLKSKKLSDKPRNHETPQLFSVFNAIQANPIWNIPVSIAQAEIYVQAQRDPYYLSNNSIRVYHKGQLVADPDTINWNNYKQEKLPFQFKQASGEGNALGKFKFIFNNSASIYLHDTNNKGAFRFANRAISHGCIRIENPLKFAELMLTDERQYDKLRMEVNLPPIDTAKNEVFKKKQAQKSDTTIIYQLKPTWFAPRKNIGVYIAYYTAWADSKGILQTRADVYGYDPILWEAIKRYY